MGGGRTSGFSPLIMGMRRMYTKSATVTAPSASASVAVVLRGESESYEPCGARRRGGHSPCPASRVYLAGVDLPERSVCLEPVSNETAGDDKLELAERVARDGGGGHFWWGNTARGGLGAGQARGGHRPLELRERSESRGSKA